MYKTKRSKLFSVGLAVLLLCSLFAVPTAADAENAFANPEFSVEGNEVTGWTRNSYSDVYPSVAGNILVQGTEGYDEDAPVAGNIFTSTTSGFGLKSPYILLNEDGRCYIEVWYKSTLDNVMQVVVEEFALEGTTRLIATTFYCPSTSGEWKLYKTHFKEQKDGERVRVTFRTNDYNSNSVENGDVHFMSPYYTTDVPSNYLVDGDFENGMLTGWSTYGTIEGSHAIETETNGNHYLKIKEESGATGIYRMQYNTSTHLLFTHDSYYKFSFKFMPLSSESAPLVELVQITESKGETSTKTTISLSTGSNLSVTTPGKWTEFVYYVQLNGERTVDNVAYDAVRFQVRPRAQTGMTVAYDDFKIEDAENNAMIYQNGVETNTLTAGTPVSARYHNVSDANATFILARYAVENNIEKLVDVKIASAPKEMTAFTEDTILEFTSTDAGDIIKTFAFNGSALLVPDADTKVATVSAVVTDN